MSTISSVSPTNFYSTSSTTSATAVSAPKAESKPSSEVVQSTVTRLGNAPSEALTYNSAGLYGALQLASQSPSSQQAQQAQSTPTTQQDAQNAVRAAQDAITQAQASLGSSSSGSGSDPFSLDGSGNNNDPFALQSASSSSSGKTDTQAAQDAVLSAQNSVSNTLGSLAA